MKICLPGESFKCQHSKPLLKEDFSELSTDFYTITSYSNFVEVTIIDRYTVALGKSETETFAVGDLLKVKVDGFIKENRVAEVSDDGKIKLTKELPFSSTEAEIMKNFSLYKIDETCPEGYYFFNNLELVVIKSVFQKAQVSFSTIITRNKNLMGLFEEADYIAYNEEALDSVYSDLAHISKFWNIIDSSQFRELLIKKILAIAESNHLENSTKFETQYKEYRDYVEHKLSVQGGINTDNTETVDVEEQLEQSHSITYGG